MFDPTVLVMGSPDPVRTLLPPASLQTSLPPPLAMGEWCSKTDGR